MELVEQAPDYASLNPLGAGLICNMIASVITVLILSLNPLGAGLICN